MATKRSHSEALLEEASQAIDHSKAQKKRRFEDGSSEVNGVKLSKAERKARKQEKRERKTKIVESQDNDAIKEDATSSTVPAEQINPGVDTSTPVILDKAEKRRRKEERKQKKKDGSDLVSATDDSAGLVAKPSAGLDEKKIEKEKKAKKQSAHSGETPLTSVVANGTSHTPSASNAHSYTETEGLKDLPQTQVDEFLASQFVTITDPLNAGYRPIIDFAHLPVITSTQNTVFKNFKAPSPIQAAAWPFLLAGRDVVGVAETGSGKTLAFGLPCMQFVSAKEQRKTSTVARAVIVSPTRELAQQIYDQLEVLARGTQVNVVCVYGGVPKDDQRAGLRKSQIIVATPGRLNDFIQEGAADLSGVGYVVLDEADRMLDRGFEDEIRKIISATASVRQTAMFTATWPISIRELAATFMKSPVKVAIGDNPSGELRANTRVTQKVEVVDPYGKEVRLLQLIKQYQSGKSVDDRILIFCLYKKEATRIENFVRSKGLRVAGIHGDLAQNARTAALESFKTGKVLLLVATDVAARGLDIPDVKLVINVTFPLTVEDYVHRIGRTGRAGREGLAITLFTEHDKAQSGALINVLKAAKQEVPEELMKFGTTVKKKAHEAYGAFYKDTTDVAKTATKITFD